MNNFTKEKKIDFIRQVFPKMGISVNKMANEIPLTAAGIQRILDGTTKNPHINSVEVLFDYIHEAAFQNEILKKAVEEEGGYYFEKNPIPTPAELLVKIDTLHGIIHKYRDEIDRLESILKKHKIEY